MEHISVKKLEDAQLEAFNVEYVTDRRWEIVKSFLERDFGGRDFRFLDVGGGNGLFADRVLESYPGAVGTIIDSSKLLIEKNTKNDRKELICESVEQIESVLGGRQFDIVFFNWLLHHLVDDSYSGTRANIRSCIDSTSRMLSADGRIAIFENIYDGYLVDGLPSYIIFELTSSRVMTPITRKLGANTAGVGVCFMSRKQWVDVIEQVGLDIIGYQDDFKRRIPWHVKMFLHLRDVRVGLFWCGKRVSGRD